MSVPNAGSALDRYRDAVADLIEAGEPFAVVEAAIDAIPDLDEDVRSALVVMAAIRCGAHPESEMALDRARTADPQHG